MRPSDRRMGGRWRRYVGYTAANMAAAAVAASVLSGRNGSEQKCQCGAENDQRNFAEDRTTKDRARHWGTLLASFQGKAARIRGE